MNFRKLKFAATNALHAPVTHRAQITSNGWKKRRIKRAWSVFSPKASIWLTYCEILPGKMSTKNTAVASPTSTLCLTRKSRPIPSPISAMPDKTTTMSPSSGTHGGTCARNSTRAKVRWFTPANIKNTPNNIRKIVCTMPYFFGWQFLLTIFIQTLFQLPNFFCRYYDFINRSCFV